jgi:cystathionine beta-lyase/cystathionine gamma-synthase
MKENKMLNYIKDVLENMPSDWLHLTTHRLDIYNEELAKTQFLDQFENLFNDHNSTTSALSKLPTAYDYIRLGHPLSSILEWGIANLHELDAEEVISFQSQTVPVLAILRKNLLNNKKTQILYTHQLPDFFDAEVIKRVYGYQFELKKIDKTSDIATFDGSTVLISENDKVSNIDLNSNIDFYINLYGDLGSVLLINGKQNESYISAIQHVRRRETISMTPENCYIALKSLVAHSSVETKKNIAEANKTSVKGSINSITGTTTKALVASSGLSMQYAIMMGLVDDALENHKGKEIKFIVPPNCYGGTNDQARRVAACLDNVEVVDLPVDGDNDMVKSIDTVLTQIAQEDAVPYIIAEIPTNPRVEVPELQKLKEQLGFTKTKK